MEDRNFVEKPQDEFNNRGYTAGQAYVIKAAVVPNAYGPRAGLRVILPLFIREKWPTLSAHFWQETDLPVGPLTEEEWLAEVTKMDPPN